MTVAPAKAVRALAATAVVGTDRSGGGAEAAARLLSQVALLGAQARAGARTRRVGSALPAPPADPRPVASDLAMGTLSRLLAEPDAAIIDEWARLAVDKHVRVADATVPVLLDWWSRQPRKSEAVFAACGVMGDWLASLNSAWRKPVAGTLIPPNAEELWQTGKAADRAALLTTVRRADPSRGLAMVQSTWTSDGADERSKFVGLLADGRSMTDEPFLEAALDDKSKMVRAAAVQVLTLLPGSRLRARMNDRARTMIRIEKKGLLKRGVKIVLEPPKEFDKSWERDGIVEAAATGKGKRAWWMRQVLESTDLQVWAEMSGLGPAAVIEALSGDDYAAEALAAMVVSASVLADPAWSTAIADALAETPKVPWQQYQGLWQSLPVPQRETLALHMAEAIKAAPEERWLLIAAVDGPWSLEFSVASMKLLKKLAPSKKKDSWQYWQAIEEISRRISPTAADQFEEAINAVVSDEPTPSIRKSIDRIRLRAEIHKEFAQ